jgi:MSHA pilin protein MshC
MTKFSKKNQVGFTMIELILVILLVGILGALAGPRFFERQSFETRTFQDQTQFLLKYAQKMAIAQNRPVYVRLDGVSVAACFNYPSDASFPNCIGTNQVAAPASTNSGSAATLAACNNVRSWLCEGVPTGLTYALTPAVSYFYFDALGKPFNAADTAPTAVSTFVQLRIRINGDGANHDVFVEPETGFVHL